MPKLNKFLSLILSFCLILEQGVFAQTIDLSHYFARNPAQTIPQSDKFRPLHLRYISYDNQANDFKILLDKGDFFNQQASKLSNSETPEFEKATQELMKYFFIGLALPNEKFWVNLRPDSPDNILDPDLEKTDIGRIFLEADLQLKKDTSGMTSPQTKEGREYWDKLYKKAGELFGTENITIPTITRPWIVPNEIIIREAPDNAYIYKATLKVMLEEDYLKSPQPSAGHKAAVELPIAQAAVSYQQYAFNDPRLKELNGYSTQLIKETIIPKLTYAVNTSKRYAPLRQVYYSLILAQWFKQKYGSSGSIRAPGTSAPVNSYIDLIDSGNLANLISKEPYDKQTYFQQYQKSFKDGEYNLQEPVYTPMGQSIRRYTSGGMVMDCYSWIKEGAVPAQLVLPSNSNYIFSVRVAWGATIGPNYKAIETFVSNEPLIKNTSIKIGGNVSSSLEEKKELARGVLALSDYVTYKFPQAENNQLHYFFTGSLAAMLLAQADTITILRKEQLPSVIMGETFTMPNSAKEILSNFLRKVGDIDMVKFHGSRRELRSAELSPDIKKILKDGGYKDIAFDDMSIYTFEPNSPEIVRINIAGKHFYTIAPLSMLGYLVGDYLHYVFAEYDYKGKQRHRDLNILLDGLERIFSWQEIVNAVYVVLMRSEALEGADFIPANHNTFRGKIEKLFKDIIAIDSDANYLNKLFGYGHERSLFFLKVLHKMKRDSSKERIIDFINNHKNEIDFWGINDESLHNIEFGIFQRV